MRQFVILGYKTNSNSEQGELVALEQSRSEALKAVEDPSGGYVRKELFELAVPHKKKHFETKPTSSSSPKKKVKK